MFAIGHGSNFTRRARFNLQRRARQRGSAAAGFEERPCFASEEPSRLFPPRFVHGCRNLRPEPTRQHEITRERNVKHHTRAAGGDLHKFMTALGTVEFWDNFHRRVSHVAHRPELCLAGRAFDEEWEKTHTVTYPVFRVTHGSRCRCFGSAGSLFRQSSRC